MFFPSLTSQEPLGGMAELVIHRINDDSHGFEESAALAYDTTVTKSCEYCLNGEEQPFLLVLPFVSFLLLLLLSRFSRVRLCATP